MAKERLSKLQKWILSRCMEKGFVWRNEAREFYGKTFGCGGKIVGRILSIEEDGELVSLKDGGKTTYSLGKEIAESTQKLFQAKVNPDTIKHRGIRVAEKLGKNVPTASIRVTDTEAVSSKAEEVSISKSFRNLESKGLIARDEEWWWWRLTEKGFLKANESGQLSPCVSFKEYCTNLEKKKKELSRKNVLSEFRHLSGHA